MAQAGNGNGQGHRSNNNPKEQGIEKMIPDLTEDQVVALKELRTAHFKEMKDLNNQMGEVRAKQRTIMSADPIDEKAASANIDERTDLINKQMKIQVSHKAQLQEILSEEQMLMLEQHKQHKQFAQKRGRSGGNNFPQQHSGQRRGNL
jgi:Spy/CpxP family protein refolding chaperone